MRIFSQIKKYQVKGLNKYSIYGLWLNYVHIYVIDKQIKIISGRIKFLLYFNYLLQKFTKFGHDQKKTFACRS